MMKTPGIYIIQNKINNKVYIGASLNVYNRLCDHKVMLRGNKHHNEHLQASYNLHGEENFTFDILEECCEDFIFSQENYWCNILNSHDSKYGYNNQPTSPNGKERCSEKTKEKMRNSAEKRPIIAYTIYGEFYKTFSDLYKCADYFNTEAPNIHRKINIVSPKKYLIDSKSSKYIFVDDGDALSEIAMYWKNVFNELKECDGKYLIHDCFDKFIGKASSKDISRILNVKVSAVSNSANRGTYLKGLKITKCK